MGITDAGLRGYNPKGVVIHNDAGSDYATPNFYRNWLPPRNKELGYAHVYMSNTDRYQAAEFNYKAWHAGNSYANANYASWEVCQSSGDLVQFLKNEQAVLDDVAKYMKQWGLTPNRDTVKLHTELSSTSCPARSISVHGNTIESCRTYFINELQRRLGASNNANTSNPQNTNSDNSAYIPNYTPEEETEDMMLFYTVDTKRWYISDGTTIRYIRTTRILASYQDKWAKMKLKTDNVLQVELDTEFGKAATSTAAPK